MALWQSGFRPFFLLAPGMAALAAIGWIAVLRGAVVVRGPLAGVDLHVHEMVFGFIAAVIAGFLLTAVKNWTGRTPASPRVLGVLVAAYLIGRVAVVAEAAGAPRGVGAFELVFMPLLALLLARPIVLARDRRNAGVASIVALLAVADVLTHVAAWAGNMALATSMRAAALLLPCMLLAVIGGRVIPMFTRNVVIEQGAAVRTPGAIDRLAIAAIAAVTLVAVVAPFASPMRAVEPFVALVAGALTLLRMRGWASARTLSTPILWILHVGYACLGLGLLLRGVTQLSPGLLVSSVATHVLSIGAIATLCLGMMTRVALGHTGRLLAVPRPAVAGYVALMVALVLRVAAAWRGALLDAAAVSFALAFVLFLASYLTVLVRARPDGAPG